MRKVAVRDLESIMRNLEQEVITLLKGELAWQRELFRGNPYLCGGSASGLLLSKAVCELLQVIEAHHQICGEREIKRFRRETAAEYLFSRRGKYAPRLPKV